MILYLDVGNTSVKWLMDHKGECVGRGRDVSFSSTLFTQSFERLSNICCAEVSRVVVSNVAGAERARQITQYIMGSLALEAEFVCVEAFSCGVSVSYKPLDNLGVDRWLAMIAAYNEFKRSCLIVDAGSAITVDIINASGTHLGGKIAPGFNLLASALLSNTAGVRFGEINFEDTHQLGQGTKSCVAQGISTMFDGFVSQVLALHGTAVDDIVFAGGDADRLVSLSLSNKTHIRKDLVFDGLKVWASFHI